MFPELRQARKSLEEEWGLRICAVPANVALHWDVLILGHEDPEKVKLGGGLSWVLESTHNFFAWAQV